MTQNIFYLFFAYEYQKYAEFMLISNPWKQLEKSAHRNSYLPKTFAGY
jgi:hypothetical protein